MATPSSSLTYTPRLHPEETIAALATAPGPGARAILRISGPEAWTILRRIVKLKAAELDTIRHGQCSGHAMVEGILSPIPVEVLAWKSPRSYTGQDLVEIHLLSSPPLVESLLAELLRHGARLAQPGEFTIRAFLAGKLDLTQAEAVLGVIEANDDGDLRTALAQLAGGIAQPLQALREELLDALAEVEAGLDFADEDLHFISHGELRRRIGSAQATLAGLQTQLGERGVSGRPFRVVLAGRPNAGKSSLFNALIGEGETALVSDIAGTTRDYVTRRVTWEGVELELIDTAGEQAVDGDIEHQAQAGRAEQLQQADLELWCEDVSQDAEVDGIHPPGILVWTKCDRLEHQPRSTWIAFECSAKTGVGLSELKSAIVDRARFARRADGLAPSWTRCRHHLDAAVDHLRRADAVLTNQEPMELLALELRLALDAVGAMTGAVYTDDLLDRVFGRFCIGK